MPNNKTSPPPIGWGNDEMIAYFDQCRLQQFKHFPIKPQLNRLILLDKLMRKICDGAINPKPIAPMGFYMRAHSGFLSASGIALAGQLIETTAILRLSLEFAAYGFYINADDDRYVRFMNRHDNEKRNKSVRSEFTIRKIKNEIRGRNPKLESDFSCLYDKFIDFGAHPNERAFSGSTDIQGSAGSDKQYHSIYIHEDGPMLDFTLDLTIRTGVWIIRIMEIVYR